MLQAYVSLPQSSDFGAELGDLIAVGFATGVQRARPDIRRLSLSFGNHELGLVVGYDALVLFIQQTVKK